MNKLKNIIVLVFHGHYDTSTEEGRNKERLRNITLTAFTALVAKLIAVVTPLVTVRLTLDYLGEEVYALWTTVVSFFIMFTFADLGLGSGLQTELSRATALNNKFQCKKIVSSCYFVLLFVSIFLLLFFLIINPFISWASLVNATSENTILLSGSVVSAIVVSKILNIPMSLIQRTQLAMQEGYQSNIWSCSANLLSLCLVIVITQLDLGVLTMIWSSSLIIVIVSALNTFVYFKKQRVELQPSWKYFDKTISLRVIKTGVAFLVLSIFTTISLSIDNFIVAHACSLVEVTPYSIFFKITAIIGVVSAMLSSPMWSANGEAMQRGEYYWVKRTTNKIVLASLSFSILASLGILLLLNPALKILTNGMIEANYILVIGMCIYQVVVSITNPYFMILNGANIVKFQIFNYLIYALISLPLKYYIGELFGSETIPWIGVITYLVLLTIPTMWRSHHYINKSCA